MLERKDVVVDLCEESMARTQHESLAVAHTRHSIRR
jgi:hypothetical protein